MLKRIKDYITIRLRILRNILLYGANISLETKRVKLPGSTIKYGRSRIICKKSANIILGDNVTLNSKAGGYHVGMPFATTILADADNAFISIGDNTRINGAYIHAKKNISIGKNCLLASSVNIIDSNGHILVSGDRTKGSDVPKEIVIGDNVWICLNSVILKGTHIGDNCVIGANSVVKGDFPSNCIIQGNPARVISKIEL